MGHDVCTFRGKHYGIAGATGSRPISERPRADTYNSETTVGKTEVHWQKGQMPSVYSSDIGRNHLRCEKKDVGRKIDFWKSVG